jgi:hypothetical protein
MFNSKLIILKTKQAKKRKYSNKNNYLIKLLSNIYAL